MDGVSSVDTEVTVDADFGGIQQAQDMQRAEEARAALQAQQVQQAQLASPPQVEVRTAPDVLGVIINIQA